MKPKALRYTIVESIEGSIGRTFNFKTMGLDYTVELKDDHLQVDKQRAEKTFADLVLMYGKHMFSLIEVSVKDKVVTPEFEKE